MFCSYDHYGYMLEWKISVLHLQCWHFVAMLVLFWTTLPEAAGYWWNQSSLCVCLYVVCVCLCVFVCYVYVRVRVCVCVHACVLKERKYVCVCATVC